jgi:hydrogenase-4 component B
MSTVDAMLLLLTPVLPLALALGTLASGRPARLLPWAALPGLLCAIVVTPGAAVGLPPALLGAELALDALGTGFLGFSALLWLCAGVYAQDYIGGKPYERGFCLFWHLTLAGSLGVCLAADVISFYLSFAFLSLAAYVLVIHDREPASLRAGRIYIALAVFGEIALLLGLMLGVHAAGAILIEPVREAIATARWREFIVLGLLLGLGLKAGLVPLHGWLPLAHSAAPVPASAVLSGAIVKAGILGLLRFLPLDGTLTDWGVALTWLGLLTAYAGVLLGLPQVKAKAVLAYSTMSQMGLLVAVIGAGMAAAPPEATSGAATLFAMHHGLAKGGLFLCVGLLATGTPGFRRAVLVLAALLGAALAGLPLTGGALAKLAAKGPLGEGAAAVFATAAAVGTMLLMLRFLSLAVQQARQSPPAPSSARMTAAVGTVSLFALLLPWLLFPRLGGQGFAYAVQGGAVWSGLWPVVSGLMLAVVAVRLRIAAGWIPVGDIASWIETAWTSGRPRATPSTPAAPAPAPARVRLLALSLWNRAEDLGARLSEWRVGAASLVVLAFLLGWALS